MHQSMCKHREALERDPKMRIINVVFLRTLSEIKLKRTDTTLDLSQKAKRAEERKKKGNGNVWEKSPFIYLLGWPVHDCLEPCLHVCMFALFVLVVFGTSCDHTTIFLCSCQFPVEGQFHRSSNVKHIS